MVSSMVNSVQTNQIKPIIWSEMFVFCLGFGANTFVNMMLGTYLPYFWSDIMRLPLAAMATIMLISRILDGTSDIFMGFIVDRTKSRFGKARPWLLWMALPGLISMSALFFVPSLSETGLIIYAFITYNCVAFFISTAMTIPLTSLLSMITDDPEKQVRMNMLGMGICTALTVFGNWYIVDAIEVLGGGPQGYWRFFTLIGLLTMSMYLLTFRGTREKVVQSDTKKPEKVSILEVLGSLKANKWFIVITIFTVFMMLYPAFMGINMYYMTWIMKTPDLMGPYMSIMYIALLITLVGAVPIVPRIGKINAAFIGMFMQIVGNLLPLADTSSVPLLMVAAALRGAGPALLLGINLSFMCDVVDYGEWKTGKRLEGLVFAGSSMGGKLGLGLGCAILAAMLAAGGYEGAAASQSQTALNAITLTFTWWYSLGSIACTIILFFLRRLDRQMPQIRAELDARRIHAAS
ncbi:MAG: MFS transporter [Deltaproteobacteria bacterium]|nr:MFS transporter [Deltaproteobacteria bacterium]